MSIMEKIDVVAVKKLRTIMDSRGVDYHTGRIISLMVRRVTPKMIDWLEKTPEATVKDMIAKAQKLNQIR